jgi:hypothetical protein
MADFVCHGAIGAGIMAAAAERLRLPLWVKNSASVYGFVVGSWPDTGDWLAAQLGLYPRWTLYNYYHHHAPWYWLIQPPFFMHVKVTDPPFHLVPGENWWPTMWSVEVLWWLFALWLLWYAYGAMVKRAAARWKPNASNDP